MKITTLSLALFLSAAASAQTSVTVTTAANNGTQTYYSLENGVQGSALLADWDLAFEITGFTSSILVNTAKGLTIFETPVSVSEWESLTTVEVENWTAINNSETYWSAGALTHGNNLSEPDGFNVGWGTYSFITHTIAGTKVYVIGFLDGSYKKLRMSSLISGTYTFVYADMDGSNEVIATLSKPAFVGKNFGYFSFTTGAVADLEPPTATWDLLFTKYTSIIPSPDPTAYSVAGVLQNKGIDALQIDGVDPAFADWTSAPFDSAMNVIGYDWKSFNMTTFQYEYPTDRTYFVQDRSGNIWKLVFTGYGGSANGDMTFNQELVSATSIAENTPNADLVLYPNPANGGRTRLVLDRAVTNADLTVLDMSGKVVMEQRISGSGALSLVEMDLNGLGQGLYLVRLQAENGSATARLIID